MGKRRLLALLASVGVLLGAGRFSPAAADTYLPGTSCVMYNSNTSSTTNTFLPTLSSTSGEAKNSTAVDLWAVCSVPVKNPTTAVMVWGGRPSTGTYTTGFAKYDAGNYGWATRNPTCATGTSLLTNIPYWKCTWSGSNFTSATSTYTYVGPNYTVASVIATN